MILDPATVVADDAALAADTRIGDYRIRGLIGEGAMGQVYLAQDLTLGRRVALKLIKREAMRDDGIARFLDEARNTARFNHPHIVTVHAVGEYHGRPYLALEFVDGESLRARLAAGPMPVREALQVCRAIADAINEAHEHGVVHADLKPENVLVRRDGRVRVVDFGLARLAGSPSAAASGTPAYMAPERWRGEPPNGAIDVWACGLILAELITGTQPIAHADLAQLPFTTTAPTLSIDRRAAWAPLVEACLAIDPTRRPTATQLVHRLDRLIDARVVDDAGAVCPFPGLAPFSRADAARYFGRTHELDEVVERMRGSPLVPIIGPSGVGKSSFVHAAVVPRLEQGGWTVRALRPGTTPIVNLLAALGVEATDDVVCGLRAHPERLTVLLADVAARERQRIALFIDQFEEVFTLARDEAPAVCDAIAAAALDKEPWRIIITLRDDFFARLTDSPRLRSHLGAVIALAPMTAAELRAAVTEPLAGAGYRTDQPLLPTRIVADVMGQPACLPLLQFACRELWNRRDVTARCLVTAEYDAMGGASGALATHAEHLLAGLSPAQIRVARGVLLSLLNPDGTRRPRLRSELVAREPEAGTVIDRLLGDRLIVASRESERDETRLELAHESLATAWPQLARWVDETFEERLLVLEIEQASLQWQRRDHSDDATWGGAGLEQAVRRVEEWNIALPPTSQAFLAAGLERHRRHRRRRRWMLGSAVTLLSAVAVGAVVVAIVLMHSNREAGLVAGNLGAFDLELVPFDWDPASNRATPPTEPPHLVWRLREVGALDPSRAGGLALDEPGRYYTTVEARGGTAQWVHGALIQPVEARGGPAFIEVDRGACAPSLVHLRHVPGYTERTFHKRIRLSIPTCAATRAGTIAIPAGPFWRNTADGRDELASAEAFSIDATEVTRAAFDVYEAMAQWTDDAAAPAQHLQLPATERPRTPIVGVTFFEARNYCRFLGKDLPTSDQWQKAFRGGLVVNGTQNPLPQRSTPWAMQLTAKPANVDIGDSPRLAPIHSYTDDRSPYGVVDLAGNVSEWTLSRADTGLRLVLGGSWGDPPTDPPELPYRITWRNARADDDLSFSIGIRCVDAAH